MLLPKAAGGSDLGLSSPSMGISLAHSCSQEKRSTYKILSRKVLCPSPHTSECLIGLMRTRARKEALGNKDRLQQSAWKKGRQWRPPGKGSL